MRWFTNRWPPLRRRTGPRWCSTRPTTRPRSRRSASTAPGAWSTCGPSARTCSAPAPDVAYVLVFENRGAEVGATISHPHGQIYAFADVPAAPRRELAAGRVRALRASTRADSSSPRRRLAGVGAARRDLALRAAARAGATTCPTCPRSTTGRANDLAAVLVDALGRLDRLFAAPMPYMLWFHQRPTDGGRGPRPTSTRTSRRSTAPRARPASSPRASWAAASTSTRSSPERAAPSELRRA